MHNSRRALRIAVCSGLLTLLLSTPASAAVTPDASTSGGTTNTGSPKVISFTTGASGSWMTVWVGNGGGQTVATVTFGATNLAARCNGTDGVIRTTLFDGTVPTSTTANVTVTWNAGSSNGTVGISSWNNVVGVGTCATAGSSGAGTTLSVTVPSTLTTDLVVDGTVTSFMATHTPNAPQAVVIASFQDGASQVLSTTSSQAGAAGSTSDGWSYSSGGARRSMAAYALQSVLPPGVATGSLLLLGVGK